MTLALLSYQCISYGPAVLQSMTKCSFTHINFARPFRDRHGFPVVFKKSLPLIFALLFSGYPSAILWRIWAIIVNPINACTKRWISHVLYKVYKRVTPSIADCNPASTIMTVINRPRIVAASQYVAISFIYKCRGLTVGRILVSPITSTILAPPCFQRSAVYHLGCAASALTMPTRRAVSQFSKTQNSPVTVSLAGEIFISPSIDYYILWINWFRMGFSHCCLLLGAMIRAISGLRPAGSSTFYSNQSHTVLSILTSGGNS